MVNITGACSVAATVWPGSTLRFSTTPLIGERITDLVRLTSLSRRSASATVTSAR